MIAIICDCGERRTVTGFVDIVRFLIVPGHGHLEPKHVRYECACGSAISTAVDPYEDMTAVADWLNSHSTRCRQ
jgi:hypothetical protein